MDFISILLFFVNIISILGMLVIATFVAASSPNKERLFFAAVVYVASLWLLLQYLVQFFSLGGDLGLRLVQVVTALSFPMSFCFYLFTRAHIKQMISWKIYAIGIIAFTVEFFLNIFGFIVQKAEGYDNSVVISEVSWLYTFYIITIGFIFLLSFIKIIKNSRKVSLRAEKIGNRFLIIGIAQAVLILVVVSMLFQESVEAQIFLPISLLFMSIMIGYAITRHGLFDIRLAVVRSVTYGLLIITLAGIYAGVTFTASSLFGLGQTNVAQNIVNVIVSLGLIFLFQPLRRFFDKITNRIFYKDNYNTDDFFAKLNKILGFTTDLRALLQHTAHEIGTTLKGEQAFFYINTDDGHSISAGTNGHKHLTRSDVDQLGKFIVKTKSSIVMASLMEDDNPIKRMMISYRVELILPLMKDSNIIGYLCLGDHLTSSYTNRDIKVLNTISNELVIAIENALSVQEIREFNVTLQQRIANATRELRASNAQLRHLDKAKDEFLSMASHQLRTPLTSVKGYISMMLDGDAGKVSKDQQHLLGEAFNNSERMVGLINDFLSISRIQTGRFVIEKTPIDLSMVVEQEVNSLRANAAARQMELIYERPEDLPIMDIDEGKIRQVIMNFIDNAIYYSHPNTKININLSVQKGEILFTVKDTGIGVPKAERDQLFTKFFRASNAKKTRPDGSGVGLFLAKKVVDDHDGKIVFDSVEGQGSTFGFSLPAKASASVSKTDNLKN
jgi:signal transduction histidine kinase